MLKIILLLLISLNSQAYEIECTESQSLQARRTIEATICGDLETWGDSCYKAAEELVRCDVMYWRDEKFSLNSYAYKFDCTKSQTDQAVRSIEATICGDLDTWEDSCHKAAEELVRCNMMYW